MWQSSRAFKRRHSPVTNGVAFAQASAAGDAGRAAPSGRLATALGFDRWGMLVFPLAALLVWLAALSEIDIRAMNDYGLISVLPLSYYAAIVILAAGFIVALRRETPRDHELLLHVLPLIVMLYGTPTIVEGTPRFEATWKHMGIVDHIVTTESVNPQFSAYFNWPLFFTLAGTFQEIAGLDNLHGTAMWSHVFLNILYLLPLYILIRTATSDRRLIWLGIWFFYLTNWVGQDYFSPQGFAFFLYLSTMAILLRWFSGPIGQPAVWALGYARRLIAARAPWAFDYRPRHKDTNDEAIGDSATQRVGAFLILVAGFGAMVPSHQLTPFAAIFTVLLLVGLGLVPVRGVLAIMAVLVTFWMTFVAVPYFRGHLDVHLASVGQVNQNIDRGVRQRAADGSDEHRFIVRQRVVYSAAVLTLGMFGGLRRILNRRWDLAMFCLLGAPPLLVAVQRYGGEIFLRIFLFSLPAIAFFVGALFLPRISSRLTWRVSLVFMATTILVTVGFLTARYGNERMDYFSPEEVAAIEYFYRTAEPGSILLGGSGNLPWKAEGFTSYRYNSVGRSTLLDENLDSIIDDIRRGRDNGRETYLILSRSSKAQRDMFVEPGILDGFEQRVRASGMFTPIYVNRDATIYVLNDDTEAESAGSERAPAGARR